MHSAQKDYEALIRVIAEKRAIAIIVSNNTKWAKEIGTDWTKVDDYKHLKINKPAFMLSFKMKEKEIKYIEMALPFHKIFENCKL